MKQTSILILFAVVSLFTANPVSTWAAEQNSLRDVIYQHNKAVLDSSRVKYGARHTADDYNIDGKYKAAFVDLNDDGLVDALVLFDAPEYCGSGGCRLEIYHGTKTGFAFLSGSTITREPIYLLSEKRYGWHSISVFIAGGGVDEGQVIMRFNGSKYPLNPSLQPKAKKNELKDARTLTFIKP